MKEVYRCFTCEQFYEKKDLYQIAYSSDENGKTQIIVTCKNCRRDKQ